jgi:hypothetical protein
MILVPAALAQPTLPDPPLSTVEVEAPGMPCTGVALVCPGGGTVGAPLVTVTVIDMYGMPISGEEVECTATWETPDVFCFCPGENPQVGITDGDGVVQFVFNDFGGCGEMAFYAECLGVPLYPSPTIYVCGPDNNGDCEISLYDFAFFALNYLGSEPCCDYDCDGLVGLADFGLFALHYQHACP